MWYDKYQGIPAQGSPLETVFLLVWLRRKEAEALATRAQVQALFANITKPSDIAKSAVEVYQKYSDAMFPFLEQAQDVDKERGMRALLDHVKNPLRVDTTALRRQRFDSAKVKGRSRLRSVKR